MRWRKKKPVARSPECEALEPWIRPHADRPYYTAIRQAFIQRFADWHVSASPPDMERLEKEWTLLAFLLFDYPPTASKRVWSKLPTEPQIVRVLRHALRVTADQRRRGRPIGHKRRVAALALDLQSTDPKRWTWCALTNHLCNCGMREHPTNSSCQKDLRRETVWLKNWLRTEGIEIPPAK